MAKHRAPTEVTIAPLFEKSALEQSLDRVKIPALLLLVAVVAWVLYSHLSKQSARDELDKSWTTLIESTSPDPLTGLPSAPPEKLASLAADLRGTSPGPWVRLLEAQSRLETRDFAGAGQALARLREEHPQHFLVAERLDSGSGERSVTDSMEQVARSQQAWEQQHDELFRNPATAESAPRVTLRTDLGDIQVALYPEQAPAHVANFLKLCGDGFYLGTSFHRIDPSFMIQGGDPNSREADPTTWGQGGAGYTLAPERNDLAHFEGVLSAAKKPTESESSGCQFFITTAPAHHLDGPHVVFGAVVEGMETVKAISRGEIASGTADRPASPVRISATEVAD